MVINILRDCFWLCNCRLSRQIDSWPHEFAARSMKTWAWMKSLGTKRHTSTQARRRILSSTATSNEVHGGGFPWCLVFRSTLDHPSQLKHLIASLLTASTDLGAQQQQQQPCPLPLDLLSGGRPASCCSAAGSYWTLPTVSGFIKEWLHCRSFWT